MFKVIFREKAKEIIVIPKGVPSTQDKVGIMDYLKETYSTHKIVMLPSRTQVEFIN